MDNLDKIISSCDKAIKFSKQFKKYRKKKNQLKRQYKVIKKAAKKMKSGKKEFNYIWTIKTMTDDIPALNQKLYKLTQKR